MQLSETVHVALDALRANKLRSFLTMLGIVIGIAAVIAMVALGRGAQQSVNQRIAALGTTLLTVFPGQGRGFGGIQITDRIRLTMEDAEALEARGTRMTAIQPEMTRNLQLTYGNKNISTNVVGATANYLTVRNFRIEAGRMFTPGDDASRGRRHRERPVADRVHLRAGRLAGGDPARPSALGRRAAAQRPA